MTKNGHRWVVAADANGARLLEYSLVHGGRRHMDERNAIENHEEPHQHNRPSPLAGKDGHSYASRGHETEEMMRRYARTLTDWLRQQVHMHHIEQLTLFAPPRLLGVLRQTWTNGLSGRIESHEADLNHIAVAELANHPAVCKHVKPVPLA
ncbi:MAG: hypothetical protein GC162_00770 [Planctomycetes bacterium]|nr:hypothetical protein [Planctomycetota bacterium]